MNPGDLDQRIVIQGLSEEADTFGQRVQNFSTLANVWAKIEERKGNEKELGDQLVATRFVDFIIRYKSGLNERMRIVYNSQTYLIESIIKEDARKSFMRITTKLKD
jgi:SPP1 family predicted phage head-tail adaptor